MDLEIFQGWGSNTFPAIYFQGYAINLGFMGSNTCDFIVETVPKQIGNPPLFQYYNLFILGKCMSKRKNIDLNEITRNILMYGRNLSKG